MRESRLRKIAETAKTGCCGFAAARAKYFREFGVVEIQKTFYDLPMMKTAEKWRDEAPEGFEYTVKAWQLITHEPSSPTYRRLKTDIPKSARANYGGFKPTDEVIGAWEKTLQFVRRLGAGKVVFQCPAGFRPKAENRRNFRKFFTSIERSGLTCIWEPRGEWKQNEIMDLCERCSLVHCVDPFGAKPVAGDIRYFRLHGISGYKYRYKNSDFETLLEAADPTVPTYIMFNNISMFEDAQRLKKLLSQSG